MQFPERFSDLPEYAFPRLRSLLAGTPAGGPELAMTIGEPRHPIPSFVAETIAAHAAEFGRYPPNEGAPELLAAIAGWLAHRYGVTVDPATRLIALNGSREGLFNAALALSPEKKRGARPAILVPNPFYPAYGAGALAAGAELLPVPATAATGFLPDYAALPPAAKPERRPGTFERLESELTTSARSGSAPAVAATASSPGGGASG